MARGRARVWPGSSKHRMGKNRALMLELSMVMPMADIANQSQNSLLMSLDGVSQPRASGHTPVTRVGIPGKMKMRPKA